jgi:hypothetical protein
MVSDSIITHYVYCVSATHYFYCVISVCDIAWSSERTGNRDIV